jgi:Ca2+-binding EF-hand superfamily protein
VFRNRPRKISASQTDATIPHVQLIRIVSKITMGQCGSKIETKIPPGWMELFASLRLTKDEVRKLYSIFCKVDLDGSGSVDTVELLTLLDIERTRFTEQIFAVFDNDGSGKVDFREFVISLWNYCTIGKAALEIFTFDLYDSDSSGELSPGEISMMLKDIYGKNHMNDAKVKMLGCANRFCCLEAAGDHALSVSISQDSSRVAQDRHES